MMSNKREVCVVFGVVEMIDKVHFKVFVADKIVVEIGGFVKDKIFCQEQ